MCVCFSETNFLTPPFETQGSQVAFIFGSFYFFCCFGFCFHVFCFSLSVVGLFWVCFFFCSYCVFVLFLVLLSDNEEHCVPAILAFLCEAGIQMFQFQDVLKGCHCRHVGHPVFLRLHGHLMSPWSLSVNDRDNSGRVGWGAHCCWCLLLQGTCSLSQHHDGCWMFGCLWGCALHTPSRCDDLSQITTSLRRTYLLNAISTM